MFQIRSNPDKRPNLKQFIGTKIPIKFQTKKSFEFFNHFDILSRLYE